MCNIYRLTCKYRSSRRDLPHPLLSASEVERHTGSLWTLEVVVSAWAWETGAGQNGKMNGDKSYWSMKHHQSFGDMGRVLMWAKTNGCGDVRLCVPSRLVNVQSLPRALSLHTPTPFPSLSASVLSPLTTLRWQQEVRSPTTSSLRTQGVYLKKHVAFSTARGSTVGRDRSPKSFSLSLAVSKTGYGREICTIYVAEEIRARLANINMWVSDPSKLFSKEHPAVNS